MNRTKRIKELEAKLAETTAELDSIRAQLHKAVWDLEEGDEYWWLNSAGDIQAHKWDGEDDCDIFWRSQGHLFVTKREAERERDYRAALTRVKRRIAELNDGWTPDWGVYDCRYYVYYDYNSSPALQTYCTTYTKTVNSDMHLKSRSLANQLVEELPEDLKTILTY